MEHIFPVTLRLSLHPRTDPRRGQRPPLLPEAWACPDSLRNSTLGSGWEGGRGAGWPSHQGGAEPLGTPFPQQLLAGTQPNVVPRTLQGQSEAESWGCRAGGRPCRQLLAPPWSPLLSLTPGPPGQEAGTSPPPVFPLETLACCPWG